MSDWGELNRATERVKELERESARWKRSNELWAEKAQELQAQLDRARAHVGNLEEANTSLQMDRDELRLLRDYLRQEHGRPPYGEFHSDEVDGPATFAIDVMNRMGDRKPADPRPMSEAPSGEDVYIAYRLDGEVLTMLGGGDAEECFVETPTSMALRVKPLGWWPVPTTTEAQMAALQTTAPGGSGVKPPSWESVAELIRDAGEDPDEMVERAAKNVDAWRAGGSEEGE